MRSFDGRLRSIKGRPQVRDFPRPRRAIFESDADSKRLEGPLQLILA
jgi:hypothetical protein